MVGIYGNSAEDRYFENVLNNHLDSIDNINGAATVNFEVDRGDETIQVSARVVIAFGEIENVDVNELQIVQANGNTVDMLHDEIFVDDFIDNYTDDFYSEAIEIIERI